MLAVTALQLGATLTTRMVDRLGDEWARLSPDDRVLVAQVAEDAAEMILLRLAGRSDSREWAHVQAQLLGIQSVASKRVIDALKGTLEDMLGPIVKAVVDAK